MNELKELQLKLSKERRKLRDIQENRENIIKEIDNLKKDLIEIIKERDFAVNMLKYIYDLENKLNWELKNYETN
jgi:hypothetical protein